MKHMRVKKLRCKRALPTKMQSLTQTTLSLLVHMNGHARSRQA